MNELNLGTFGENLAVQFLIENGYKVVDRNFRSVYGEVDIIAQENDVFCFVEVKTRQDEEQGSPFEAITKSKQRQIARMALQYLENKNIGDVEIRFDAVSILIKDINFPEIELIKNAFQIDD